MQEQNARLGVVGSLCTTLSFTFLGACVILPVSKKPVSDLIKRSNAFPSGHSKVAFLVLEIFTKLALLIQYYARNKNISAKTTVTAYLMRNGPKKVTAQHTS